MVKFAVFGSSFVTRLNTFCSGDLAIPGECNFFWTRWYDSFKCVWEIAKWSETPDVVFLHIGGNDIRVNSSCKAVCENIKFIVDELYRAGNKVVFVAEICERGNFTKAPGLTYDIFKKQKNTVNRSLQKLFGDKFVKFKDISFPNDYDKDLVHFSDSGMKKYFYRIRRTFLSSRCMSDK